MPTKQPKGADNTSRLVVIGEGYLRHQMLAMRKALGLGAQVELTGLIPREQVYNTLARADLAVSASRVEGLPVAVLEAMACGCPVISSNASSLPEVAGDAAILVDSLDVAGMTRAMDQVLSDSGLRQALRAKGLVQAAKFSWDQTARDTLAVYQKVAS